MGYATKDLHNHLVYYDSDYPHRWLDVIGPDVVKHIFDGVNYSADLYTVTTVNASTISGVESTLGGQMVFTSDGAENDGVQAQLLGEAFYLSGIAYPCYFGARFKVNDADQVDAFLGLAIQDTTILAGVSDSIGFRTVDESASLTFLLEKGSSETEATVATLSDDTYVVVEFYYDGDTVEYYVDGSSVGSYATSVANMPDDEHLAPALALLTGETAANTMTVDWARWFQVQA
jgi:hypothetical protein